MKQVRVVRIYGTEGHGQMRQLLDRLHDQGGVRGVTLFRAISGFGASGQVHAASLLDLSLDLPLVMEFFDTPERVDAALGRLGDLLQPGHWITWVAEMPMGT
jgi:PII-like signaling protein